LVANEKLILMALQKVHLLRFAQALSLRRTISTPHSSTFASLASGAFCFAIVVKRICDFINH